MAFDVRLLGPLPAIRPGTCCQTLYAIQHASLTVFGMIKKLFVLSLPAYTVH